MKSNTRKLVLNSLLLAMGLLLHQLTPAIGLPMQPDMALIMLFVIMVINKDDYKTSLVAGIVTGLFTALTTKFPVGQVPNILDKIITTNIVYVLMYIMYRFPVIKRLSNKKQNLVVSTVILPLGTLISGTVFLGSAQILVGLPGSFITLFLVAVAPAIIINLVVGLFIFKIVDMSISRVNYQSTSRNK